MALLLAASLTAASLSGGVLFEAPRPGAELEPLAGAEEVIRLVQGHQALLWTTLGGAVEMYQVLGWPASDTDTELGGALMIRKPTDSSSGVIDLGERPKSVLFQVPSG